MIRKLSKKEQILDAALKLVSKKNSFDFTIREIAKEADVNIAAINYYFKSKSRLFIEMEKLFTDNYFDAFTPLEDDSLSDTEKLTGWLNKAISYGSHYPGILVLLRRKYENPESASDKLMKADFMKKVMKLKALFASVIGSREDEQDKLFAAFCATLVFPFIMDSVEKNLNIVKDEQEHLQLMLLLINKFKER